MEQSEEMKERFDGLYHKTIPLILFAPTEESKKFTKLLSSLFCSFDNVSVFNEVYASLSSAITGRSQYDHHQETLISSFMEQYTSLNQRLRNIESTYFEFKGMVDRINKDHQSISYQGKRIRELSYKIHPHLDKAEKINERKLKQLPRSNDKVDVVLDKTIKKIDKIGTPVTCECGYAWTFNGSGNRASCRKCHRSFKITKQVSHIT